MLKRVLPILAMLLASTVSAQTPDPIHWPSTPTPAPPPPPTPSLAADELFVIGLDVDATVVASPTGIVTVTTVAGPITIRGKFVGGSGVETRTFTNKQVVTVEATGSGQVELIVVWGGVGGASKVERRVINVGGTPVPPAPMPPAPTDPLTQSLSAAYAADTDPTKSSEVVQLAALYRVASTSTVNDTSLATTTDLLARMQTARKAILPDTAIPKVRAAIEVELNKTLSTTQALDAPTRQSVGALFARVATALEAIK